MLAATLVSAAPVLLTPTSAMAANECGDPTVNTTGSDSFTCTGTFSSIIYTTQGNLTLRLRNPLVVTTGGLQVTASNNDAVTINRTSDTTVGDPQITNTSGAAIQVIRVAGGTSGNITVSLNDTDLADTPDLAVTGTTYGINLVNVGSGSVSLTTQTSSGTITATNGVAVRLAAGTGNITFTNGATTSGTAGGLLVSSGGNATVQNNQELVGGMTFNNTGNVTITNTLNQSFGYQEEDSSSVISGPAIFNNGGTVSFTNTGHWNNITSATTFASGGTSTLINRGTMQIDGNVTFTGLDSFTNQHRITFGTGVDYLHTDGQANDRLSIPVNMTVSHILIAVLSQPWFYMDFGDGGAEQTDCATAAVGADCLDLRGRDITGNTTYLTLLAAPVTNFAGGGKLVLIDMTGGTLSASDFTVHHTSTGYQIDSNNNIALVAPLVTYRYVADEDADQVYLTPIGPGSQTATLLQMSEASDAIWTLGADAMFERQLEIRDRAEEGIGLWLRGVSSSVDDSAGYGIDEFEVAAGYDQETVGIVGGVDVNGGNWSAGVAAGSFDGEIRTAIMDMFELSGHGFGAYASWGSGPLFANGLLNYTKSDVTVVESAEESETSALGVRGEVGWRLTLAENIYLEPNGAVSWVNLDGVEFDLDDVKVSSDDISTFSVGLGARVTGQIPIGGLIGRFAFGGRAWQPLGGAEQTVTLTGTGGEFVTVRDDNQDILGDMALTAGLHGWDDRLSLTATGRLKFKESYQDTQFMLGLRYRF